MSSALRRRDVTNEERRRASVRRRPTSFFEIAPVVEIHRPRKSQTKQRSRDDYAFVRTTLGRHARKEYAEELVIEPVKKKPPIPPKNPNLKFYAKPTVTQAGGSGKLKQVKIPGVVATGSGLTVGRFPSGGLFVQRRKTYWGKEPVKFVPWTSDSSSSDS
jgi:hypothetical protein